MNIAIEHDESLPQQRSCEGCDVTVLLPASFRLESGEPLSQPELRLRIYGETSQPVIAVAGGISSGRAVADSDDQQGWWCEIVSDRGAIDLEKFCVLSFDFLPNPLEVARTITTKDQARALSIALDSLKIERLFAFVGASYGGMTALAFAAAFPDRIDNLCMISAAARTHPAATALRGIQRRIVEFASRYGEEKEGVALARQLAMINYRTPEEFDARFDNEPGVFAGAPYDVCEYLISRGRAFDMSAQRYVTLSDSIDRHLVDPSLVQADSLLVAAHSDRLVPAEDMRVLARNLSSSSLVEIDSLYGHDAFLKETAVIGPVIKSFLEERLS
ncbi:MAG: homoserine O-acetyltransferase [Hyphococcus sp.]|nr:MAG: homoserine O-acetyltransferase [Marinicaulis sp.]